MSKRRATDGDLRLDRLLAELSPPARRVVLALGVRSLEGFFRLTREQLMSVRGCGKRTVKEIERLPAMSVAWQRERIDDFFFQPLSLPPELSVEARRVLEGRWLFCQGGTGKFLSLNLDELQRGAKCERNTVAEIEALREQLRRRRDELYRDILDSFPYSEASGLVLEAVRSKLSYRAVQILAGAGIIRLEDFMVLDRRALSRYRNCGSITAGQILARQSGLAEFALRLDPAAADFSPESLLAAPCLQDVVTGRSGRQRRVALFADLENPARWLIDWVVCLAPSPRHTMVFLLRRGMLGGPPLSGEKLRKVAGGVSQCRISQIEISMAKRASNPYQQYRLRPLMEELAAEIRRRGGVAGREELLRAVLCRGEGADQFRSASGLMQFFSKLPAWWEAGLRLGADRRVHYEAEYGSVYAVLHRIYQVHRRKHPENRDFKEMCCMWSRDDPPDFIEDTPLDDIEEVFRIEIDDDAAWELYDMNLGEAARKIMELRKEQCRQ